MIYLDNGATSYPKPRAMINVMSDCMLNYCGNPGRSGHSMSMKTGLMVYNTRKTLAELFNVNDPSRIVFTVNTTGALNQGIKGFLKEGDHVITTAMEHNSILRPLKALEARGISHSIIKCDNEGFVSLENIERTIKENTRLIACTHASNVTGTIMPIKEIGMLARSRGITFIVDGAQSAGCVPIDVEEMNIDMLALPGHKGLLGPLGTGMLYVRDGIELEPIIEGGTGTASKERIQPKEMPEGLESGTINAPGIIGLGYSAKFVKTIGVTNIRNYEEELTSMFQEAILNMEGITVYGPRDCKEKTAVVAFNIEGMSPEEVTEILSEQYGIAVRGGFHCAGLAHKTIGTWETGAVRVSIGPFNTKKDIYAIINAVRKISKK